MCYVNSQFQFDKGEDLSAVLAGFFGKPVKESMISQLFGQRRESSTSQLPRTKGRSYPSAIRRLFLLCNV